MDNILSPTACHDIRYGEKTEGTTRNDGNERKSKSEEKRVWLKSKLFLWFCTEVFTFIGSLETFVLSLASQTLFLDARRRRESDSRDYFVLAPSLLSR